MLVPLNTVHPMSTPDDLYPNRTPSQIRAPLQTQNAPKRRLGKAVAEVALMYYDGVENVNSLIIPPHELNRDTSTFNANDYREPTAFII